MKFKPLMLLAFLTLHTDQSDSRPYRRSSYVKNNNINTNYIAGGGTVTNNNINKNTIIGGDADITVTNNNINNNTIGGGGGGFNGQTQHGNSWQPIRGKHSKYFPHHNGINQQENSQFAGQQSQWGQESQFGENSHSSNGQHVSHNSMSKSYRDYVRNKWIRKHGNVKNEQYNSGQYSNGQYTNGQHNNGQYNNGQHTNGQHNHGQHSTGQYNDGQYNNGQHNSGQFNNDQYTNGQYSNGQYNKGQYNNGHNSGWNQMMDNIGNHVGPYEKIASVNMVRGYSKWGNNQEPVLDIKEIETKDVTDQPDPSPVSGTLKPKTVHKKKKKQKKTKRQKKEKVKKKSKQFKKKKVESRPLSLSEGI